MVSSILLNFNDTASSLGRLFDLSKQNLQLNFVPIQLHDAVFRFKFLEEELNSCSGSLANLEKDDANVLGTLHIHSKCVEKILHRIEKGIQRSDEPLLR